MVVTIGFSGLSSSGKTTVAKAIINVLPNCHLIHQDDFYFPPEQIPYDEDLQEQNWDSPDAIDFAKFTTTLQALHDDPDFKYAVDSLEIDETTAETTLTPEQISILKGKLKGHEDKLTAKIYLIDGFMLYCNDAVIDHLDLKLFFKAPYEQCKARRAARQGYNVVGGFWVDPPGYFDKFVWPAYYRYHKHLFVSGDDEDLVKVTGGDLNSVADKLGLKAFDNPNGVSFFDLVDRTLQYIIDSV